MSRHGQACGGERGFLVILLAYFAEVTGWAQAGKALSLCRAAAFLGSAPVNICHYFGFNLSGRCQDLALVGPGWR
ncbi:hypothetical protein [Ferrimonas pelagia]|uniref:Uncharacterized protein n=1 Tax=Ferrimonas pelagia TaxID=1177826 RepID=A0ABP9EWX7_9GAMM